MGRKLSTKERFRIGLDFFEFLRVTSRANVTDATGLRDIYNTEFRERNQGKPLTNFGSVMFALKKYDKIRRQKGAIVFQTTVREIYVDQWQPARGYKQRTAQNRPANPGPVQNLPSSDGEETHDQIWREQASLLMVTLQENRKDLISDKHGIRITSEQEFIDGKINFTVKDTGEFVVNVNVTNTGTNMVHFTTCTPLSMVKYLSLTNDVAKKTPLQLQPGDSHEIQVHFSCSYIGFYPATLAFEFKSYTMSSPITFHIVRDIETYCLTALGQELQPVARYTSSICPVIIPEAELYCQIVDGQRPDKYKVSL